ncbi:response regulator transcription factor [Polynucleobacter sp. MWH-Svant-W18]|uniref:response regulator transcription factor n=1 Tax=Polynucleobacter sp. MWH-Svant-W18 TaxID=1855909 RepID=UPI001BFECA86|nr:response regulator transcription factor [Polynucleobacter sp. MWH-Svant-W18]QWD77365.1 response regulator transcription factor [Polynucleobacter sp. MWH-Svant-W18]
MLMNTDANTNLIKVQVVDRQQIALWGIDQLIKQDGRFQVCATATNAEDALKHAINSKPDVIVLDPELGDEDGIGLISTLIDKTKAKVIVYTSTQNPTALDQSVVKGARGVINKTEPVDILLKAIEKIHIGELWLNRNATSRILLQIAQANSPKELSLEQKKLKTLTSKEEKVTRAIQLHSEKTLKQISESLHISEHTLRNHLASIYDKLGVRNRMELYVFCGKFQKTDNPNAHPKRRSTDA